MAMARHLRYVLSGAALAVGLLAAVACGPEAAPPEPGPAPAAAPVAATPAVPALAIPDLSPAAQAGAALFNANCALCHGVNAAGTQSGPPLVHRLYEPGHHSDAAFHRAVQQGVSAHHWPFGDMPPQPALSPDEVSRIICYVRALQVANGIMEGVTC